MKKLHYVFLNYSKSNLESAQQIYNELNRRGISVWFDKVSLIPGLPWRSQIKKAISECRYFLVLLSKQSLNHIGFVQKEIKIALEILDLFPENQIFIVPIRLENCNPINERLNELQWIDLFPMSTQYSIGIQKILDVIKPGSVSLRSIPSELSISDAVIMIRTHNYFDAVINPEGSGISHIYEEYFIDNAQVIFDRSTGLLWTKRSSSYAFHGVYLSDIQGVKWLNDLNCCRYSRRNDWRLPTLEEAMSSLIELNVNTQKSSRGIELEDQVCSISNYFGRDILKDKSTSLYINQIFGNESILLTSDLLPSSQIHWRVYLESGQCGFHDAKRKIGIGMNLGGGCSVKAVCVPDEGFIERLRTELLNTAKASESLKRLGDQITKFLKNEESLLRNGIVVEQILFQNPFLAHIIGNVKRNDAIYPLDLMVELYRNIFPKDNETLAKRLIFWILEFIKRRDQDYK